MNPPDFSRPAVALVGSRRCTYYGERVARDLAEGLAEAGVVTVSGLARGIDRIVHHATLEAGGDTWAVLGSGLDRLYPSENTELAQRIQKKDASSVSFPWMPRR